MIVTDRHEPGSTSGNQNSAGLANLSLGIAGAAVAAALAILIHLLHRNGFWVDELYTLHAIRLPWQEMILERLHRGHFSGYFLLIKSLYEIVAPVSAVATEALLRSFSIVCWAIAVASFVPLARRYVSPAAVGIAIMLLALNGTIARQAGEARMYTLLLIIAVWMTRCYLEMLETPSAFKWGRLLIVLTPLGFAVSASISMLSLGLLYDSLRRRRKNPGLLKVIVFAVVSGIVVFIPGAILHLAHSDRVGIAGSQPIELLMHVVTVLFGVQIRDDYFRPTTLLRGLQVMGAVMTLVLVVSMWITRSRLSPVARTCVRIVFTPFVVMLGSEILSNVTHISLLGPPRYLISIMPAAALLVASVIEPMLHAKVSVPVHLALSGFLVTNVYAIQIVETETFRERVYFMKSEWYRPGDGVAVVPHEAADGLEMYAPGVKVDVAINRWETDPVKLAAQLAPLRSRPRVILVTYRPRKSPALQVCEALFGPATSDRPGKIRGSLRVFRFRPEQAGIEDE